MNGSFFAAASSPLVLPFLIASGTALVVLALLGLRWTHLLRIALRQVPRRPGRSVLIVIGLMFATMFIAASLAVDDTITLAVQSVAVFNLGKIDEDVTANNGGDQHLFDATVGQSIADQLAANPLVAGVAPALVIPHVFVADQTTRQVRGNVTVVAMSPVATNPLTALHTLKGANAALTDLQSNEIYLNRNAGTLMNAKAGDTVLLTSTVWNNQRRPYRVRAVVTGGPLGDAPAAVLSLAELQQLANASGQINHVFVANAGDGLTGVGYSDSVADAIYTALYNNFGANHSTRKEFTRDGTQLSTGQNTAGSAADRPDLDVQKVKQDGVNFALRAQDIFGRILGLYTLFALALGLLLIFLIFVLLAAERRVEIGTVRTLGMRQGQVVLGLLFEGALYDGGAALLGIAAGAILTAGIVAIITPTLSQIGFPLQAALNPQSLLLALGGGFLFTLATIGVAAWATSRVTIAAALRDLPEPSRPGPRWVRLGGALVLAIAGLGLISLAVAHFDILIFSFGLTLALAGAVLLVRLTVLLALRGAATSPVRRTIDRLASVLIGGGVALYWSLPFDALVNLGLPRFSGGIEVFFIAGVMMIAGTVLALAPNLDLLLWPVRAGLMAVKRVRHVVRVALVYPVLHRWRTAISLSLFALVVFTMVVMDCIAASATSQYDNLPAYTAGYTIAGRPLTSALGSASQVRTTLAQRGQSAGSITALSSATSLALGMFQPGATNARWGIYPAAAIDGNFLNGVGLPLAARAQGFNSDGAVWDAVRNHPGNVVIDAGALSQADAALLGLTVPPRPDEAQYVAPPIVANIQGFSTPDVLPASDLQARFAPVAALAIASPDAQLRLSNLALGSGVMAPTPLWVADLRGNGVAKLTIVGIVENARGQRYGLMGSAATFASVADLQAASADTFYYFQTPNGTDAHKVAQQLGSRLFDQSFETTVLQDLLLDANGPRVFISRVLVGLVGLTLLVGMAALAVTGSRAVVERRQQIGMLRALGFRRRHVRAVFLMESFLIGGIGTLAGVVLGLALCRNVFAVDFFAPIQSGLVLVIPWGELGIICAAALGAALLASLLPAWQAGRVTPADALRYE